MTKDRMRGLVALLVGGLVFQTGCVSPRQVQAVRILHGALQPIEPKRQGTVFLTPLADARQEEDRPYIGEIRQPVYPLVPYPVPSGRFIVIKDTDSIGMTLTRYLTDALKEAGYTPVVFDPGRSPSGMTSKASVVLEGEIREFWLRASWTTTQAVRIHLRLLDARSGRVMWECELRGESSKFIGTWNAQEFEEVIQTALDRVFNQAGEEFASEQFFSIVTGGL
jgi:hypothetical protein